MHPTEKTSVAGVIAPLVICSGAIYVGVPTIAPEPVASAFCSRAIPKSMILTRPSDITRTLDASRSWISGSRGCKRRTPRSEEHTSELQSRPHLVCRLLLEKKKKHTEQTKT